MSNMPGKIQVNKGTWTDTCTVDSDLMENQAKYPAIRTMLEYADQRMITTLLVSGAVSPYGIQDVNTGIPKVDEKKSIGNNAYRFNVMGRIQIPSEIDSQVGGVAADGTFQLRMKDNYLIPGMNVLFNGQRFQARVMSLPQGTAGGYIYTFQTPDGSTFDWTTHVAGQQGVKTVFGGYTSYGEKSLRGHGRSHFPDTFIQHMTIQRKSISISGGAGSDVLWYEVDTANGPVKGWMYEQLAQAKAQFLMEDEFQKWFGISTMKASDGTLLIKSRLIDPETGLPITQGDGFEEQIRGGNEFFGSGVNGEATADDFGDMVSALLKKSDKVTGVNLVAVTGEDGYNNAQKKMRSLAGNEIQLFQNVAQTKEIGGAEVDMGFHFKSFNINGNKITFVKHPMFDDDQRFTERGSDGKLLMSSNYYFLTLNYNNQKNIECLAKEAHGINRSMVMGKINGMTGASDQVLSEEDANKYMMLKENLICVYNTTVCGLLKKAAN